jgi:phosphate/sulfate permease
VLQVFSACAMSFVHGANDVANAMGPLSGVYQIWSTGQISSNVSGLCQCCLVSQDICHGGF